jgi:hypothetical protein
MMGIYATKKFTMWKDQDNKVAAIGLPKAQVFTPPLYIDSNWNKKEH